MLDDRSNPHSGAGAVLERLTELDAATLVSSAHALEERFNKEWARVLDNSTKALTALSIFAQEFLNLVTAPTRDVADTVRELDKVRVQLKEIGSLHNHRELLAIRSLTNNVSTVINDGWGSFIGSIAQFQDALQDVFQLSLAKAYATSLGQQSCTAETTALLTAYALVFTADIRVSAGAEGSMSLAEKFERDMRDCRVPAYAIRDYLGALSAYRSEFPLAGPSQAEGTYPNLLGSLEKFNVVLSALRKAPIWSGQIESEGLVARLAFLALGTRVLETGLIAGCLVLRSFPPAEEIPLEQKRELLAQLGAGSVQKPPSPEKTPDLLELEKLGESLVALNAAQRVLEHARKGMDDVTPEDAGRATEEVSALLGQLCALPSEKLEAALALLIESHELTLPQAEKLQRLVVDANQPKDQIDLAMYASEELGVEYGAKEFADAHITAQIYDQRRTALLWHAQPEKAGIDQQTAQIFLRQFLSAQRDVLLADNAGFEHGCQELARMAQIAGVSANTLAVVKPSKDAQGKVVAFEDIAPEKKLEAGFSAALTICAQQDSPLKLSGPGFSYYLETLRQTSQTIAAADLQKLPEFSPLECPADYASVDGLKRIGIKRQFEQLAAALDIGEPNFVHCALLRWVSSCDSAGCHDSEALAVKARWDLPYLTEPQIEGELKVLISHGAIKWRSGNHAAPFSLQIDDSEISNHSLRALVKHLRENRSVLGYAPSTEES